MSLLTRQAARLGAAVLLAAAALAVPASPAHAAGPTDLSLDVVGTRLVNAAVGKNAYVKITNLGDATPGSLSLTLDLSGMDERFIGAWPHLDDCDDDRDGSGNLLALVCDVPAARIPGPGETLDLNVTVFNGIHGEEPRSFPLTVTIDSPDDTNEANNSRSTTIELAGRSGPDVGVRADDVTRGVTVDGGGIRLLKDLRAGQHAQVVYAAFNQGDQTSVGLRSTVALPQGVTFAAPVEGCDIARDGASAICTWKDVVLVGLQEDTDDDARAGVKVELLVRVDDSVEPGPLPGGAVTVASLGVRESRPAVARVRLPDQVTPLAVGDLQDIDASDNTDGFAVVVAAGPKGDGGGGDGGDGGGGGLPVTGPQAALVGGAGVAVVATGTALLLLARRRRVVLVTPGDERSAG